MLFLGVFSLDQMAKIQAATEKIIQDSIPSIQAVNDLTRHTLQQRNLEYQLLLSTSRGAKENIIKKMSMQNIEVNKTNISYRKLISSTAEQRAYDAFTVELEKHRDLEKHFITLSRDSQSERMRELIKDEMRVSTDKINIALSNLANINAQNSLTARTAAVEQYDLALKLVTAILTLSTALILAFVWSFTRSVTIPISASLRATEEIANGKLTSPIVGNGNDEPGRLLQSMEIMRCKLQETLSYISHSAHQLACAGEELSNATEASVKDSHDQNAEIEQAVTAVHQMTCATEEIARNAVNTSQATQDAIRSTDDGLSKVQETVTAIEGVVGDVQKSAKLIGELATNSKDISKVLEVIRSLAEQTNLLALNAAIEAARAGDAGRGFAVVAEEVRALAYRTQQSTNEIETIIDLIQNGTEQVVTSMRYSTENAEEMLAIARGAGHTLETINRVVVEISERNLMIASAAEEQAQVAREIDRSLINISELSVNNTATAGHTRSASGQLTELAVGLDSVVARFQI